MKEYTLPGSDGNALFLRESGSGPLLLLIHGSVTDCDFFHDTQEYLSRSFHVVSYDRRGHARSAYVPSSGDALTAHAEDAYTLIRHFSPDGRALVVAHSYGGAVAMRLAAMHPESIRHLVLNEPITDLSLSKDKKKLQIMEESATLAAQGNMSEALRTFMLLVGEKDPRGRKATEQEMANIAPDARMYYDQDYPALLSFHPDYEALEKLPVTVALSDLNRGKSHYTEAEELGKRIGASIAHFPGHHNCGFDLPREYAMLLRALLLPSAERPPLIVFPGNIRLPDSLKNFGEGKVRVLACGSGCEEAVAFLAEHPEQVESTLLFEPDFAPPVGVTVGLAERLHDPLPNGHPDNVVWLPGDERAAEEFPETFAALVYGALAGD